MKKTIFISLVIIVLANLVLLIIALTNPESYFYQYRWIIGISMLVFGGFLRQHLIGNNKVEKH